MATVSPGTHLFLQLLERLVVALEKAVEQYVKNSPGRPGNTGPR